MSKIDFPIGVELPLRGGGVAVLYEFMCDHWFGRVFVPDYGWYGTEWGSDGASKKGADYDILPPKRKAWVVWYPDWRGGEIKLNRPAEIVASEHYASLRAKELGGTYQEITEP